MVDLIAEHKDALSTLCRKYRVERLYVFGSAAKGELRESSDLDFLVVLADRKPTGEYAERYLDLAESLEDLFGRPVDLLTESSVRNPYLRREIESTCELIYG